MKGNQETFIMTEANSRDGVFPSHVFRTYDIRGHAERELTDGLFEKIGFVLGEIVLKDSEGPAPKKVGLGRDARISSPRLFHALARGLSRHGNLRLVDLGLTTTPMLYFSSFHFEFDAAFQVTASHNPAEDNGLKMMLGKSTIFGDRIQEISRRVSELELAPHREAPRFSASSSEDLHRAYLGFLKSQFRFSKPYRVAVDCGNGMAGLVVREALSLAGPELHVLYEEVDCQFPNHPADPTIPEFLKDLQRTVTENKCDIGFAFDGDADRIGVVTRKGRVVWGDEILMLLSEKVLREKPGSCIIAEVKCSEKLFKMIRDRGGRAIMYKTGHSLIKEKMKQEGAPIAGEMSGHMFFADRYFGFDDAIYAALRVIEALDVLQLDLDDWLETFPPSFITPEIRVECREDEKIGLVQRVRERLADLPGAELNLIDGVRASFDDGSWVLVRASNTQAVLVVRIEASSERRLEELREFVSEALGRSV